MEELKRIKAMIDDGERILDAIDLMRITIPLLERRMSRLAKIEAGIKEHKARLSCSVMFADKKLHELLEERV